MSFVNADTWSQMSVVRLGGVRGGSVWRDGQIFTEGGLKELFHPYLQGQRNRKEIVFQVGQDPLCGLSQIIKP